MKLDFLSIRDVLRAFRTRELSPVTYLEYVLSTIETHNPVINAFFFLDANGARKQAKQAERRWLKGTPMGALDGIPFAVKDNISSRGMPSPLGLKAKQTMERSSDDAPVVARLREAGGILVGKNTQPELACVTSVVSGLYGIGRNPWDVSRTPGGSSGGCAAAVAADMVPLTIGGDSGGSVRIPAAYSGVVGFKPSFGRVPRSPPVQSAAVHGPMTRTAADLALVMNQITRPDGSDVNSLPYDGADYTRALDANVTGKRIAVSDWFGYGTRTNPRVSTAFRNAVQCFSKLGAEVCPVAPFFGHDPYEELAPMIAAGLRHLALAATGGVLQSLVPEIRRWAEQGGTVSVEEFINGESAALDVVTRISAALEDFDYLVTPTVPTVAYEAERCFPRDTPLGRFGHTMSHFPFTWPFNFSGQPAISIPCGFAEKMPVGLQIVAKRFDDSGCISAAIALESVLGLSTGRPTAPSRKKHASE